MAEIGTGSLGEQVDHILRLWEARSLKEIPSAKGVASLVLRNSLPIYLRHLSDALAHNRPMDMKSVGVHDDETIRIGRLHGADRAENGTFLLTEMISEYHILRQVIFEVLEAKGRLDQAHRNIILDSIERAVNDAATKFSEVHSDIQEKFINTLTHDLKNPIAAAQISAQLILQDKTLPAPVARSATRIYRNMTRVTGMIHDLLDAGRLRAGNKITLEFEACDVSEIVAEVVEEMEIVHGTRFHFVGEKAIVGVWSAAGVRRVAENLVGNAVKYATPDSAITVTVQKHATGVELIVHNLGNPITRKDIPTLFEHHRRLKSVERNGIQGWGLGLTVVKGVVDAHRGSIRVESDADSGTAFKITLPTS